MTTTDPSGGSFAKKVNAPCASMLASFPTEGLAVIMKNYSDKPPVLIAAEPVWARLFTSVMAPIRRMRVLARLMESGLKMADTSVQAAYRCHGTKSKRGLSRKDGTT